MLRKILQSKIIAFILSIKIVSKFILKNSTIIVVYHGVSYKEPFFHKKFDLNVKPNLFENQIRWLKNNFNIISPIDLLNKNYKKPAAMITFDDGDKSYIKTAVPILKKHNIPSIMFLNMDVVGGSLSWAGISTYLTDISKEFRKYLKIKKYNSINFLELDKNQANNFLSGSNKNSILKKIKKYTGNFLSVDDLKKLDQSNLVFFGNHLYNHYNVINLNYKDLKKQYLMNQNQIRKYKNNTKFFAYPFGQKDTCYNLKTNKILFKLGANAIFSNNPLNFITSRNFFHRIPMGPRFNKNNSLISHLVLIRFKQLFYWNFFSEY